MGSRELLVQCPSCHAHLAVDERTGKTVRWSTDKPTDALGRPQVTDDDWDAALSRVRSREERASSLFESALQHEKDREEELDEQFSRRLRGRPSEGSPVSDDPWHGVGLALRVAELSAEIETESEEPRVLLHRSEAIDLGGREVATLAGAIHGEIAAELSRRGATPSGARSLLAREVGAKALRATTPTRIHVDGRGLALAPALDADRGVESELGRVEGALVAAEKAGARMLSLRVPAGSEAEERLIESGFRIVAVELLWTRAAR